MCCNAGIYLIQKGKPLTVVCSFSCGDFFHRLAVLRHRKLVEALVVAELAARLFPEGTEVGLEFAVAPHVVVGIVAVIRHRVDVLESEGFCNFLRGMQDEVFRAVRMATLRDLLDDLAR